MSKKIPSQDSNFENPRPEEEIAWDIEELKRAIKRSAEDHPIEQWDDLLDSAGQIDQPPGAADMIWEAEKKKFKK